MRRSLGAVAASIAFLVAADPALAQRVTGNIVGTVRDDTGAVLPGVGVSVAGANIVGAQTAVTNAEGFYRFPSLPPGTYDIVFELQGFAKLRRQAVQLSLGATEEISVSMKVSQMAEEVTVSGEAPVVDTQTNQISTNYDKEWVRNAPVPRFSMFDLISVAPGISQSCSNCDRSTTMTAFGSGTDENSFQIDGTNLTAPSTGEAWPYPNTDAIEEIEVLALGAPAEYGNVTGAVFNVITRQGTNEFHGDANFYYQADGLTGRNTTDSEDDGFPYHREHFYDTTFQLSGPILKDKLWFFASYQYQTDADSPAGVDPLFFVDEKAHRVFGKLTWQINPKHKLALGYHNDYYTLPGTPSADLAPTVVSTNTGENPTPNLMYTGVLSDKTVIEARVAGFWGDDHADPIVAGEARTQPRFYDLDSGQQSGGIYYWYDDKTYQATASAKISHFADDFLGASHDFKFGVQYVNGGVHDAVSKYNDVVYTYTYTDYYGSQSRVAYGYQFQAYGYGGITHGVGLFLDDTVRINDRLNLNLGVRYDHNTASIPELSVRDLEGAPTGEIIAGRDLYTWDVFAPRLGFNLKLTKDGKTVLKGHYGRYYRGVVTAEYSNSIGTSPHVTRACPEENPFCFDLASNQFVGTEVIDTQPASRGVDPGIQNPYTDQFVASLERELAKDLGLSLHYINKRARRLTAWRETNGQYEDVTILDDSGPGATGRPVVVQRLLTDPNDRFFVLGNRSDMKTDTHAFTAQVTKRMADGWQLIASYTYLNSEGILPSKDTELTDRQNASSRFSSFGQNPNDLVNAGGKLLGDRPHTFKAQLVVELPWQFLVGANFLHQSGRAWARRARVEDPDLGFPTAPEINIEERDGNRRVPDQNIFDMRLQKSFSIGEKFKVSLFADGLNLFNAGTHQGVLSRFVDVDNFGVPSDFIFPRRIMLGAKTTF